MSMKTSVNSDQLASDEHLKYEICFLTLFIQDTVKPVKKRPLSKKRPKIGFQDQLSLNAGQKYCKMLQGEHSDILLTFIKLPFVIKIFVLSIFEWPFYAGFTVLVNRVKLIKELTSQLWKVLPLRMPFPLQIPFDFFWGTLKKRKQTTVRKYALW